VAKSAPLLEDYKQYSYAALMFNHQFLIRRTLLIFSCFFLNSVPQIQALIYIYLSLMVLGYLVFYLPFADRTQNWGEIQNELTVYFGGFHALLLTTNNPNPSFPI